LIEHELFEKDAAFRITRSCSDALSLCEPVPTSLKMLDTGAITIVLWLIAYCLSMVSAQTRAPRGKTGSLCQIMMRLGGIAIML
jgi:hypothetical protein